MLTACYSRAEASFPPTTSNSANLLKLFDGQLCGDLLQDLFRAANWRSCRSESREPGAARCQLPRGSWPATSDGPLVKGMLWPAVTSISGLIGLRARLLSTKCALNKAVASLANPQPERLSVCICSERERSTFVATCQAPLPASCHILAILY